MPRLLVVDDEPHILGLLQSLLKGEGYEVVVALDGAVARGRLESGSFDLLLTDLRLKPIDGIQLLELAHKIKPSLPVILLTGYASVESAIEAMRLGAFDYITKPFKVDELLQVVRRAIESASAEAGRSRQGGELESLSTCAGLIADSAQMKRIQSSLERLAPTDAPVLFVGEPGSGREFTARILHQQSTRKESPFIHVDCTALSGPALFTALFGDEPSPAKTGGPTSAKSSLMEQAKGGTLYFDEIIKTPPEVQVELARIIREKTLRRRPGAEKMPPPVDVRLLGALNADQEAQARDGGILPELYKRMSVFTIRLPPLRERKEDILLLWHCLAFQRLGQKVYPPELSPEASDVLISYPWPGNIPEMEGVIRQTLTRFSGPRIERDALPPEVVEVAHRAAGTAQISSPGSVNPYRNRYLRAYLREKEREHFAQVLAGDKSRTTHSASAGAEEPPPSAGPTLGGARK